MATPPGAGPDATVADAARAIENVRRHRVRPARDVSIQGLVEATQANAEKVQRRAGGLVDLWTTLLPPEIVTRTEIVALRGSILQVRADSSAVAFDVDRRLRGGLLQTLRERSSAPLTRVRVTVGGPAA